jgi:hypothetical protein
MGTFYEEVRKKKGHENMRTWKVLMKKEEFL